MSAISFCFSIGGIGITSLRTYFHICRDNTSNENSGIDYKPQISYDEILKIVAQSKVIIDLTQEKQSGLTLRPLEAIFFKKKLITNNVNIEKCRFYNKNNIYVIDTENIQIPITFFSSPYEEIGKRDLSLYLYIYSSHHNILRHRAN